MTREEEIEKELYDTFDKERCNYVTNIFDSNYRIGFRHGAEWADSNPKIRWVSIEDDVPYRHEELTRKDRPNQTKDVLVRLDGGYVTVTRMTMSENGFWEFPCDVTHWMPIQEHIKGYEVIL